MHAARRHSRHSRQSTDDAWISACSAALHHVRDEIGAVTSADVVRQCALQQRRCYLCHVPLTCGSMSCDNHERPQLARLRDFEVDVARLVASAPLSVDNMAVVCRGCRRLTPIATNTLTALHVYRLQCLLERASQSMAPPPVPVSEFLV